MIVRERLFSIVGMATLLCVSTQVVNAQTTFTSTGGTISVSNSDAGPQPVAATNGNPSAIVVPGTVTGTVSNITVRLNALTASVVAQSGQDDGVSSLGILLVHKATGKSLELMYAPGDANVGFSNVTFNFDDSASSFQPSNGDNCLTDTAFPSQSTYTYKPSSFEASNALNTYPGFSGTVNRSGPCFQTTLHTLNGVFDGVAAAGEWDLYVNDNIGFADVSIGSWALILTTAAATSTTTTVSSSVNPSFTATPNNSTTLTADVTSSSTVNTGAVAFSDGASIISGCGAVAVNGSGVAACTTTFTTQGFHAISAAYTSSGSFAPSTGTLNQFVEFHPTISGNQFCNSGAITVGTSNASGTDTQPYGSVMNVSGIPVSESVSTVQLVLNNFTMSETVDISMLLVSPDGNHALDFFDFIGGGVGTSNATVTFADGGVQAPNGTGGLTTTTYEPTSFRSATSTPPPSFLSPPAPAPSVPGSFGVAAPGGGTGSKTFLTAFNGATPNGPWSLFIYDHANPNTASVAGGWCLTITPAAGAATVTTVSGAPNATAPNGAAPGAAVTVTAVVKSSGVGVTKGSVVFTENGAAVAGGPAGAVNAGTSGPTQGMASFTTTALPQGDHNILATYTDSTNAFNESFGSYVQRVDNAPIVTVNGTTVSYCNTGKITYPDPNDPGGLGPAFPNPSNINVNNLFGTIKTLTLTLNGYQESASASFLDSVLIGPAGNKAASLDFFSGAGGGSGDGPFNLFFADSGSTLVPTSSFGAGTYKPTAYNLTDTFTASTSTLYSLPATYNYSPTSGTSTFTTVYANLNPIGNWDLYFNQAGDSAGGAINTGWCLNFTQNPPVLSATKSHTGNFTQGQQGAQFTITVANNGPGSAGGAIGITVTDTIPAGLTPVSGSGSGWSCPAPVGQVMTCTNANVVASGSSFPVLTLNVNVANNASASVNNVASVNGSGNTVAVNSNTDSVTINPAPVLSISKASSGTFTQGQTALWNVTVSNSAGASSTTSGTLTVVDTLPTGYSFSSSAGTGWSCGAVTVTVTCASTTVVNGGSSYPTLGLTVNVPTNSPTSVTNSATAFGGGDLNRKTLGTGVTTTNTVSVVQVVATVNLTLGNNQSVAINTAFPTNFSVTVLDAGGVPINGATVTFTAPAAGASGTFAGGTNVKTATTNSSGVATATVYTSNSTAGGPYNVSAAAGSITNNFSATNLAGAASSMTANAGTTPQSATINTAFANALAVTVKDAGNNPVAGLNVTFTAPGSGASGKFSNNTATITVATNASGVASAPFTANGTSGGVYTVTAAASGVTTVNFSLTNTAGSASTMTANAGTTPQSATISTAFANALAVTVKDSANNPVSGVSVTFTAPGSGASGLFANSTTTITVPTNASGVASAPFTANSTAGGPYTVTAAATGLTTVNFSLTNTTGAAASITANAGTTPQSATINTAFANALAVTVKDVGSNPVSGVNVTFTSPGSGSSGIFSNSTTTITVATNASGVASAPFTANGTAGGPYTVTAAASGLTTVNFSLTNTSGAAASMTANAGTTPQSATINTAFANALAVTVKDAGNNPLSGINVTFTSPGSGASGKFSNNTTTITVATNASGVASAPFTANGTAGGPYTVTAAATGLTTVNFTLTNTAGAATSMTANAGTTPQSAAINTAFANALAVTVKDAGSNPLSGINVTFTAPGSGASGLFSNSTTTITVATNASGIASAPFTANGTAGGPYTVTAAATGLTTVNFSLTNTAGAATSMTANAGTTPQSATINTAFANALSVTVKDAGTNPVSGVNVTFTAPGSGASGLFANSTTTITVATNASGIASAPFTANGTVGGPYTVTAAAAGLTTVNFSLSNTTGAAATMTANAGTTPQSATVNTAFANALAVTVKDAGTNPVSGVNVTFTAPGSGASGLFANSTTTITVPTNASGVASAPFTANGTAGGPYTVTAAASGLTTVNFSLTNNAVVATGPTVVSYSVLWGSQSYNVIGSPRNRLPWQITGIQVVFSAPITTGDINSLSGPGITTTGFSGLGTNTLTWSISPLALGNFPTTLAGSGTDALKDAGGNGLANGAGFAQNLKILYGDFHDDGVVNSQDLVAVQAAIGAPYNIFADLNGDGLVSILDYTTVRSRVGTSLP